MPIAARKHAGEMPLGPERSTHDAGAGIGAEDDEDRVPATPERFATLAASEADQHLQQAH